MCDGTRVIVRQSNDIFCTPCFIGLAIGDNKRPISIINPAIRALPRLKNKLRNHRLFNEDVFLGEEGGHLLPADSEVVVVSRLVSCYLSLAELNRFARCWRSCL